MAALGRIDRYDLLDLLGEGSFGAVYRARHIHTGTLVALKLGRGATDPDAASRILAEGRAAASLRHPNVVGVLDGGVTAEGDSFVVMELLEGETLAAVMRREGPFAPSRAVAVAIQILDALEAAHAAGVIHRDVKPSNVFVTKDPNGHGAEAIKVIDFGISKLRLPGVTHGGALTLPGMAMGTPGYMAPEQLGDARSVDARADIYSAGATLYEMLSKKRPIDVDRFETWIARLTEEAAPKVATHVPTLPRALGDIVDRAVARDRDGRWPSAASMRAALVEAMRSEAGGAEDARRPRDATLLSAPAQPPARGAWTFAIIGVALALLSVIAVGVWLGVHRARSASSTTVPRDAATPSELDGDDPP